jgi:hypothetical protein
MFNAMTQHLDKGASIKSNKWTAELATELVAALNPLIKGMGVSYQVMIGGALVTSKQAAHLDLIFMPTFPEKTPGGQIELLTWLGGHFGKGTTLRTPTPNSVYQHSVQFNFDGMLINAYIGG